MKKLFALILVLSMVLSMVPAFAETCANTSKEGYCTLSADATEWAWARFVEGDMDTCAKKCKTCGGWIEMSAVAGGHVAGDWNIASDKSHYQKCPCGYLTNAHAADFVLQADGTSKCSVCGLANPAAADCEHKETEPLYGYDAKCNKDNTFTAGLTNGAKCADCGTIVIAQEKIEIKKHLGYNEYIETPATCEKPGLKFVYCDVCEYEGWEEIPKDEAHTWVKVDFDKNCKGAAEEKTNAIVVCTKASCEGIGYDHYKCECGAEKHVEVKALGHDYNTQLLINASELGKDYPKATATMCNEAVYSVTVCGRVVGKDADGKDIICGKWDGKEAEVEREADTHEMAYSKTVAPTCVEKGYDLWTCANKGCTQTEKRNEKAALSTTGHPAKDNWVKSELKADTCTEKGLVSYTCPVCGTVEKEEVDVIKGHTNNYTWTGCFGGHLNLYYNKTTGHYTAEEAKDVGDILLWEYVDATCKTNGYWQSNCERCGENYIKKENWANCATCRASDDHHVEAAGAVILEPTCTTDGYAQVVCSVCGTILKDANDEKDELWKLDGGHDWEFDGVPTVAPSCSKLGEGWMVCARCGEREYRYGVKAENYGKCQYAKEYFDATCTEPAMYAYVCVNCGEIKEGSEQPVAGSAALGHDYKTVAKVDLCNYAYGQKLECSRCGEETYKGIGWIGTGAAPSETGTYPNTVGFHVNFQNQTVNGEATYGEKVLVEETCTTDGLKETKVCLFCDYVYPSSKLVVIPGEHDYQVEKTTEANCVAPKTIEKKCSKCDDEIVVTEGKPLETPRLVAADHANWDIVEWVGAAATCTTSGRGYYGCTACGDKEETSTFVPAHHTFDDKVYEVIVAPTCSTKGTAVRTCVYCGALESGKTISLNEVGTCNFGKVVVESGNCMQPGYIVWECVVCGAKDTKAEAKGDITYKADGKIQVVEYTINAKGEAVASFKYEDVDNVIAVIPAGAHKYGKAEVREATCTVAGGLQETCEVCGYVNVLSTNKAALGHDPITTTEESTCYVAGHTTTYCYRCNEVLVDKDLPMLQHELKATPNKKLSVEATCGTIGYDVYECKHEGCKYTEKKNVGYDTDNHVYVTVTPLKEMNCKENKSGLAIQKCKYCDKAESVRILPVEHDYVLTSVKLEATCTDEGTGIETCSVCGKTSEVDIPMTEHTLVTETVEADCDEVAGVATYCSVCSYKYSFIKTGSGKLGHIWGDKVYVEADCENDAYFKTECQREGCTEKALVTKIKVGETGYKQALGHDNELVETFNGTCIAKSYKLYNCKRCGEETKVEGAFNTDKKTGHKYEITFTYGKEVDCGNPGYVDVKCELCGNTLKMQKYDPACTWSNYIVTEELVYKVCLVCGEMDVLWAADSFTGYNGCTTIKINGNGEKIVTGTHKGLVVNASKEATCTEEGELGHIECTVCGTVIQKGGVIPAHKTENVAEEPAKCGVSGFTAGVYCTVCEKFISGHEVIPALEHKFVKVPAKAPTATETGLTEGEQCELCGEWKIAQEVLPVKGAKLLRTAVIRETAELLGTRVAIAPATTVITITGVEVNGFYPVATALGNGFIHNSYIEVA